MGSHFSKCFKLDLLKFQSLLSFKNLKNTSSFPTISGYYYPYFARALIPLYPTFDNLIFDYPSSIYGPPF